MLFFGCVIISDLYLFQETVLLNPYFKISKSSMSSFIVKVTNGTLNLVLFISNVPFVNVSPTGLCLTTAAVLDISEITQFFACYKSTSISGVNQREIKRYPKITQKV